MTKRDATEPTTRKVAQVLGHPHTPSAIVAAWGRWLPATVRVGEGVEDALLDAIPGLLASGYERLQVSHALAAMTLLDPAALASPHSAALGLDRAAFRMQSSRRYRDRYRSALARFRTAPSTLVVGVPASPQSPRSVTLSRKA